MMVYSGSRKPSTDPFWIKSNPLNMQIVKCFPLYTTHSLYSLQVPYTYTLRCSFYFLIWHLLVSHFHFHFFRSLVGAFARWDFRFYQKSGIACVFFFLSLSLRVTRYSGTESPSSSHTKRQKYWMKFSSKWHSSGRWAEVHILIKMICAAWIYRFVVEIVVCLNARYICTLLRYRLQSAYTPTTYDYLPNIEREWALRWYSSFRYTF